MNEIETLCEPMSVTELAALMDHIIKEHHPYGFPGKQIKYIDPIVDARDGKCFAIKLRGWGRERVFSTAGAERNAEGSLYQIVHTWLLSPEW